jgi:small subunit ribosomal protein S7
MARSSRLKKRPVPADPIYNSRLITKLINRVMKHGKKRTAANHVYGALNNLKKELQLENPLSALRQALDNIKPSVEVRSRRVGGANYQVPMPVKGDRRETLAIRWLVIASRSRSNKEYKNYTEKLTAELKDAYNNQGGAIKKKIDTHKMAEANKAFAHFRW